MKVVCVDADGEPELTLGAVYRLESFVGDGKARLYRIDALFDRRRFLIIDLEHDARFVCGTVITLQVARTLGQWPGQVRQKKCKCSIPPGVLCEYHGP
jgi:hypothetical protein